MSLAETPLDPALLEPHVSTRLLRGLLMHLEERGYGPKIDALIEETGLPRAHVEAPDGWVSNLWIDRLLLGVARHLFGLDALPPYDHEMWQLWRGAGQRSVRRDRIGAMFDMARALGSPRLVYANLPTMSRLANRTLALSVQPLGSGRALVTLRMNDPQEALTPPLCWNAIGLLEAVPSIWGLPLAEVRTTASPFHPDRRADHLEVELRYHDRRPLLLALGTAVLLALSGVVAGLLIAPVAGSFAALVGAWAAVATVLLWMAARWIRRRSAEQTAESERLGALIYEADQRYSALWQERVRLQASLMSSQKLSQYLSPELVKEIIDHPDRQTSVGGRRTEAAVLFIDLVGFTPRTERRDPIEVLDELNLYFSHIDPAFARHGGIIDKRMGDGVMAVFLHREGEPLGAAAGRALRCGLDLVRGVEDCNRELRLRGVADLRARVGVAMGPLVQGTMGSALRFEYTVIGDVVNTAARLEGQAGPGQIAVPVGVFDQVPAAERAGAAVVDRRRLTVKGKEETLDVVFLAPLSLGPAVGGGAGEQVAGERGTGGGD